MFAFAFILAPFNPFVSFEWLNSSGKSEPIYIFSEVSDISKYSPIYSFRYCSTSFQSIPFLDLNLISLIRAIFEPSKSVIILTLLFIFLVLFSSYQISFDIWCDFTISVTIILWIFLLLLRFLFLDYFV